MTKLTITELPLKGAYIVETNFFEDHRGVFARWFCEKELENILNGEKIVNVNFSKTMKKGTVRGMHFQYPPKAEVKLVRCIRGKIWDTIVDLRKDSDTYLEHYSVELSEENMLMLIIPKGFAHGFQSLEDKSEIMYLVTEHYSPECESGVNPIDPKLNIKWPLEISDISIKDESRGYIDENFKELIISN